MLNKEKTVTAKYSKEASDLNKLVIKLKKEVLKGTITVFSADGIDEATIPALNILWGQKYRE